MINLEASSLLGYVFYWKVGNHLKLLFLIGPGIFLVPWLYFFFIFLFLFLPGVPDSTPGDF